MLWCSLATELCYLYKFFLLSPSIITIGKNHIQLGAHFVLDFSVGAENGAKEINNKFLRVLASLNFSSSRSFWLCIWSLVVALKCNLAKPQLNDFYCFAIFFDCISMIAQEIMSCEGPVTWFISFVFVFLRFNEDVYAFMLCLKMFLTLFLIQLYQEFQDVCNRRT